MTDATSPREAESELYRREALAAASGGDQHGRPLHVTSGWTRWTIRLTAAAALVSAAFLVRGRVGEYAHGVAVVRKEGRVVVTATQTGVVSSLEVRPGEAVRSGDVLIRLDATQSRAELDRIERQYQQRLLELLRNPTDAEKHEQLAILSGQRDMAQTLVREREIVALQDGVVSEVRVRRGQSIAPGDAVATVESATGRIVVLSVFPGRYRPLLQQENTRLFLSFSGFADSRHEVALDFVSDEVVGPAEAKRHLGQHQADALDVEGPVVVVQSVLVDESFSSFDGTYEVYDGMHGQMEARVRSESLLEVLIPAFKRVRGPWQRSDT